MINVHNIMEEQIITRVNELYDQVIESNASWLSCDCENCRLDTISYVLNRTPPRYVVSGRGVSHNSPDVLKNNQVSADADKLIIEGMKLVNQAKRSYHKDGRKNPTGAPATNVPVFNFPNFVGNLYDGSTFEPLPGATVLLKLNDKPAEMMDVTWPNPCKTFAQTNGNYTFWVSPIPAVKADESEQFRFTLEVQCEGYTSTVYSFTVPLVSENCDRREINSVYSLKVQDLFLFREDVKNSME